MKKKYIIPNSTVYMVSPLLMEDTGVSVQNFGGSSDPEVEDVGDILGKGNDSDFANFVPWED